MSDFKTVLEREYIPVQTLAYQTMFGQISLPVHTLLGILEHNKITNQASLDAVLKDRTLLDASFENKAALDFLTPVFRDMKLYHEYYRSRLNNSYLIPLIKDFQAECAKAKDCESQPDVDVCLSVLTYLNDGHWNFDSYFGNMRDYIELRQQSKLILRTPIPVRTPIPADHRKFLALAAAGVGAAALIGFAVHKQRIKKRKKKWPR